MPAKRMDLRMIKEALRLKLEAGRGGGSLVAAGVGAEHGALGKWLGFAAIVLAMITWKIDAKRRAARSAASAGDQGRS